MRHRKTFVIGLIIGLFIAVASPFGYAFGKDNPYNFPPLTGRVVDSANEIPEDQEKLLTQELELFEKNTGHQLVVVTIPDLNGVPVSDYGYQLGRFWGIGRKGVDDGIILLQSPGDGKPGSGKLRIEVGRGMEYILTDAESSRILNSVMIPILKTNKPKSETIPLALTEGARAIMKVAAITPEQKAEFDRKEKEQQDKNTQMFIDIVVWVCLALFVLIAGIGAYFWLLARKMRAQALLELEERHQRERDELQELIARRRAYLNTVDLTKSDHPRYSEPTPVRRKTRDHDTQPTRSSPTAYRPVETDTPRPKKKDPETPSYSSWETPSSTWAPSSPSYDFGSSSSSSSSSNSSSDSFSGGGGDFGGGGADSSY